MRPLECKRDGNANGGEGWGGSLCEISYCIIIIIIHPAALSSYYIGRTTSFVLPILLGRTQHVFEVLMTAVKQNIILRF